MKANSPVSLAQALAYIEQLDLSYIIASMCSDSYLLPRWTLDDAEHCCKLYKRFLMLQKKYATEHLVPTREIDEFWHNHILHTQQYIHDCKQIFGHYLHHQPASSAEAANLVPAYLKTKQLYAQEFQQDLATLAR